MGKRKKEMSAAEKHELEVFRRVREMHAADDAHEEWVDSVMESVEFYSGGPEEHGPGWAQQHPIAFQFVILFGVVFLAAGWAVAFLASVDAGAAQQEVERMQHLIVEQERSVCNFIYAVNASSVDLEIGVPRECSAYPYNPVQVVPVDEPDNSQVGVPPW